jgi:hypothetical protein
MKDKHTQGPWHVEQSGSIYAKDEFIGIALDGKPWGKALPQEANARLMAAAPELLEVLELLLLYSRGEGMGYDETYHRAEKLIAKIEGDE